MWAHEAVLVSRLGKDDGSMAGKVVQRPSCRLSGSHDLPVLQGEGPWRSHDHRTRAAWSHLKRQDSANSSR